MAHLLFKTGRVVITQFSSGNVYRDSTIQLVKVPNRTIIDALWARANP